MKIVEIQPKNQFLKINGRVVYGIAEYDDHLLAAHKVAAVLAMQCKLKISDFKYQIIEKSGYFGVAYSVNAKDVTSRKVTAVIDDFSECVNESASDMASLIISGNEFENYFDFEEIDVEQYELLIKGCSTAFAPEDIF